VKAKESIILFLEEPSPFKTDLLKVSQLKDKFPEHQHLKSTYREQYLEKFNNMFMNMTEQQKRKEMEKSIADQDALNNKLKLIAF